MTLLAPWFLVAAALAAAVVVALHFIVTREPRTLPFPTARFAPDHAMRARARSVRPQDLLLMALRMALLLAAGLALSRPVPRPARRPAARILVVDRSRAVARAADAADSLRATIAPGDALVLFDSAATVVREHMNDSLAALVASERRGSLSTALIVALRAASQLREAADSFEMVLVSPLARDEVDFATDSIRRLWPGRIRVIRTPMRVFAPDSTLLSVDTQDNDPVLAALPPGVAREGEAAAPPAAGRTARPAVRLLRRSLGGADSAWARMSGRTVVYWPADAARMPPGWTPSSRPDTVGAVEAGEAVVAPFERAATRVRGAGTDSDATVNVAVRARWVDGAPAAVDEPVGDGCLRTVTIPVPSRGDLVLQPRFRRLVESLLQPCGHVAPPVALDANRVAVLTGTGAGVAVASARIAPPAQTPSPLARWLLVVAAACAVGEWVVRRRAIAAAPEVS